MGPGREPSGTISIGVAAHITAASIGGPRFDPHLGKAQRQSIDNGIWLCADCARLVDGDPTTYTVATLRDWRAGAESIARESLEDPQAVARAEVARKFEDLRTEVTLSLNALRASQWRPADPDNAAPRAYLRSMLESAIRLGQDADLIVPEQSPPYVAVDASELYAYTVSRSDLVVGLPLMDYCIEHSQVGLLLPPGTIYELHQFVTRLSRSPVPSTEGSGLALLQDFVKNYEDAPDADDTRASFAKATNALSPGGALSLSGLGRLKAALARSLVTPLPDVIGGLNRIGEAGPVRYRFQLFEKLRPERTMANWADAVNLSVLANAHSEMSGRARMISSSQVFAAVAQATIPDHQTVRTSREYAMLVRVLATHSQQSAASVLRNVEDPVRSLSHVVDHDQDISPKDLPLLQSFAVVYRDIFSPTDAMIRDAVVALPRLLQVTMADFYRSLVHEADLARGFRRWWNSVATVLNGIDVELTTRHRADQIHDAIDGRLN